MFVGGEGGLDGFFEKDIVCLEVISMRWVFETVLLACVPGLGYDVNTRRSPQFIISGSCFSGF